MPDQTCSGGWLINPTGTQHSQRAWRLVVRSYAWFSRIRRRTRIEPLLRQGQGDEPA